MAGAGSGKREDEQKLPKGAKKAAAFHCRGMCAKCVYNVSSWRVKVSAKFEVLELAAQEVSCFFCNASCVVFPVCLV